MDRMFPSPQRARKRKRMEVAGNALFATMLTVAFMIALFSWHFDAPASDRCAGYTADRLQLEFRKTPDLN